MNTLNLKLSAKPAIRPAIKRTALGLGLLAVGTVAAMAASAGGPFSAMNTFMNNVLLPGIGGLGVAGGIGYAAVHAFKHDYGKSAVGAGVAVAGGLVMKNSTWFQSQAQVSAATIGHHVPLIAAALHAVGL
jgi:hypothetical protein